MYTVNEDIINRFEICPLHNSVVTLNGARPDSFDMRAVSSTDKDRTFNFNKKIKRYAYVADGGMLQYDFANETEGTVMMRAYTDVEKEKQYLLECNDSRKNRIGLYRGSDGYLYIDSNGEQIKTPLLFSLGVWHTVGISYRNESKISGYTSQSCTSYRVYLDGNTYSTSVDEIPFNVVIITVGRKAKETRSVYSMGSGLECWALHGQIEMLAVNRAFNETSTLDKLSAELESITKTDEYDEMGLLKKTDVHRAGKTLLSHTYGYGTYNEKLTGLVSDEIIKYGAETAVREYTNDALGRITKINDTKFGSHIYTYDYRGFLTKADRETFEYDANGNITKYDGAVFGYDSVIKDKLVSVGGKAVSYASASSLNPTGWNGRSYGYEGRRLTSFNSNGKSCSYEYDEQSHRISKTVNGAVTRYIYSGDNLVIEDGPNGKLFFLYDENGQLYGFVKDEKRYFYIKDITGTILGIADESGDILGNYEYSAYGKCTVTDNTNNTNNIAEINPFRFKCYYYDTESGMYYCHTRYLVPEWGRWLNTDNPGFLQFDNINGMNLFAYCNNNPVMYADPSGELLLSLLIAAFFGATASAIASTIVQAATTHKVDVWQVAISALFGAVSGALSFWGIGGVAGQFIIQGALGVGEMYAIAGLNGTASEVTGVQVLATFLFAGSLGAIGGKGGTKGFNRAIQIEKDFLNYAGREIGRYGTPMFTALKNWGGKYAKEFIKTTFLDSFAIGGVSAIANIADYWIQKLYDEFK